MLTRTDWLGYGKPALYVLHAGDQAPGKTRDALRKAATSGESHFFVGTDSAPHP